MEMLEQNRMLLKLIFEQHAEWKKERTRMLTELDRGRTIDTPKNPGNQSKIFKMVDPHGTAAGRPSWLSFSKHHDQTLHPISSHSQEAIPIKSSKQSLFSTPGITIQIRLSDRRKTQTHPSGLGTYERPRTRVERISNSSRTSFKRCTEIKTYVSIQRPKSCSSTSNYHMNQSEFTPTA